MKKLFITLTVVFCCLMRAYSNDIYFDSGNQELEDYQCLLIHNFIKNIDWTNSNGIIRIGILGNSKILPKLTKKITDEKLNVTVKKIGFIDEVLNFDIVFIPKSQSSNVNEVVSKIATRKILLIGEDEAIARDVDICFIIENSKLRFSITKQNVEEKEFKISTKLLQYAKMI